VNPSRRPFVLPILTALLAACLVLPGCLTTSLWQDRRGAERSLAQVENEHVRAIWSKDAASLFVRVPAAATAHFCTDAAADGTERWLEVTPREHRTTAFVLTTLGRPFGSDPRQWPDAELVRVTEAGRVHWELRAALDTPRAGNPDWTLAHMPGWSWPWTWPLPSRPAATFKASCRVVELPRIPQSEVDRPVMHLRLLSTECLDPPPSVAIRVLATPIAVALDTVFALQILTALLAARFVLPAGIASQP
jgi:hypothetical protein